MKTKDNEISVDYIYTVLHNSAPFLGKPVSSTDEKIKEALIAVLKENPNFYSSRVYKLFKEEKILTYSYTTFWRRFNHLFKKAKQEFKQKEKRLNSKKEPLIKNDKNKSDLFVLPDDDMKF